jgi:hypothetical protein
MADCIKLPLVDVSFFVNDDWLLDRSKQSYA